MSIRKMTATVLAAAIISGGGIAAAYAAHANSVDVSAPLSYTLVANDPTVTGIELPGMLLAGDELPLPAQTSSGTPISWEIDASNNPNGASIVNGVLHAGEVSVYQGGFEALGLQADVAGTQIKFTVYVVTAETISELGGDRGAAIVMQRD